MEYFLLLATDVLAAAFYEADVVRFLLEAALCFELARLDESGCLLFFWDLETACLDLFCESAASEAVRWSREERDSYSAISFRAASASDSERLTRRAPRNVELI